MLINQKYSFALLLLTILVPSFTQASDLSVSPAVNFLNLKDNTTSTNLVITNHSSQIENINLSTKNLDSEGSIDGWVTYSENNFALAAGSKKEVSASIKPSTDTISGAYLFAFVVTAAKDSAETPQTDISTQIASKVFLNYYSANDATAEAINQNLQTEALEISKVKYNNNYFWPSRIRVSFELKNISNYFGKPHGLVRLTDKKGKVIYQAKVNSKALELSPQKTAEYFVDLEKSFFETGSHHLEIIASLQEEKPALVQKNIIIFPWVGALIIITVLFFIKKRRKLAKMKL